MKLKELSFKLINSFINGMNKFKQKEMMKKKLVANFTR